MGVNDPNMATPKLELDSVPDFGVVPTTILLVLTKDGYHIIALAPLRLAFSLHG